MKKLLIVSLFIFYYYSGIDTATAQEQNYNQNIWPMAGKLGFHTYTTTTVRKGCFQLDTELSYFRNTGRHIYTVSAQMPGLSLRYGITNSLEVSLGTAFSYSSTRFKASQRRCLFCQWQYGNDFITAGFRLNLLPYRKGQGQLTLIGQTQIPGTNAEGMGTTFRLPVIQLVNAYRINAHWGYTLNVGTGFEYGEEQKDFVEASVAGSYYLEDESSFFLSLSHRYFVHTEGLSHSFADAGLLLSLNKKIQVQTAVGVGFADKPSSPDFSGKVGVYWRAFYLYL